MAKKTFALMEDILEELKDVKDLDMLKIMDLSVNEKMSFKERAWNNFLRRNFERTQWYYDDVKKMAKGETKNLDAFEASK